MIAQAGGRVVISSRKSDACDAVRAAFESEGLEAIAAPCHVADAAGRAALVEATLKAYGRIDALVTNAGVNPIYSSLQDLSEDSWDKVFDVNLKAAWQLGKLALPEIARQGHGAMVMLSSIGSVLASPGSGAYAVAKAGVNHMARQLAGEWGPSGVRVNSVAPGVTRTDMIRARLADPAVLEKAQSRMPLRRVSEPEDIAAAILFLISDAGRQITGQTLVIDSGATLAGRG
jgi:NAD(P)-dependent dehydrogenase (short-subunit alcohol dehydrogenase family)